MDVGVWSFGLSDRVELKVFSHVLEDYGPRRAMREHLRIYG